MLIVKLKFVLILSSIFLFACDPAKILVLNIESKHGKAIILYTNNRFESINSKRVNEQIIVEQKSNEYFTRVDTTIYFGIGGWDEDYSLPKLCEGIDSIVITSETKVIIKDKNELFDYLKKRRSGIAKSILTIKI